MGERQAGSQDGVERRIDRNEVIGNALPHERSDARNQGRTEPSGLEPRALHPKKSHLVEGIEQPQVAAELQTIENHHGFTEADMLGSKIAMAIDDMPGSCSFPKAFLNASQGRFHPVEKSGQAIPVGKEVGSQQDGAVFCHFRQKMFERHIRIDGGVFGRQVKIREGSSKAFDIVFAYAPFLQAGFQDAFFRKPIHLDKPIDRFTLPPQSQGTGQGSGHCHHSPINAGREAGIQPDLLAAIALTGSQACKVEIRITHGLLELEHLVPGEEDP
ncbi:hypothetical protein GGR34_002005 [Microvirga flocculans]|uniref:Uncharacterized protein n=1 Tax=Microvirga flocculans TaxID=217168 RepID=A0A7W6N860_9HYPH|nr:hypothetical protein [Microvirga flocculans]MBB4040352.1 hypothetical protein [Microvirga flocculans]